MTSVSLATFGAGCFWGTEAAFQRLSGVISTSVGYMGGHFDNPCYLDVLSRITGHAEVAQVEYMPAQISYAALLDVFWQCHDPTSLNRQGADRGDQYRSVIFYHTPEQQALAEQSKAALARSGKYEQAIVTQIKPASTYWLASEEHQQYFGKRAALKSKG
ncbi:MAG: peptide-methionine (S)-S-oxide reductase MsrA [Leptolyngbya sp. SIOISBB]|nr:peptide-methionine (S)-S-oxide reductase MsrA [Leptolyngbya sp. SIOISBB]